MSSLARGPGAASFGGWLAEPKLLSRRAEVKADWHPGVNHGVTAMQGTSDASGTTVSAADPI